MKIEVKKRNSNPDNYADLLDRVNANGGEKQNFETQFDYRWNGQAKPKNGLMDSLNGDIHRNDSGLKPLKDYLNQMIDMHFEMNKEYFAKKRKYKTEFIQVKVWWWRNLFLLRQIFIELRNPKKQLGIAVHRPQCEAGSGCGFWWYV
jgi:hypothetical protein